MFKIITKKKKSSYTKLLNEYLSSSSLYYLSQANEYDKVYQFFKRGDASLIGYGNTPEDAFEHYIIINKISI